MGTRRTGGATGGMTEDCEGLTAGRRRSGAISSSSSEIVICEWETAVSSSSEITIVEWVMGRKTEGTGATGVTEAVGMTEGTGATGVTEATEAAGITEAGWMIEGRGTVTEATDTEGVRGAGGCTMADRVAETDALRRSNSMKCVYDGRTDGKLYICLIQLYYNSEENITSL